MNVVDFDLPATLFRILPIHAEELCRKECGLVAARARANLEHYIFLVVRILRQKQFLQLCRVPRFLLPRFLQFLFGELAKLLIPLGLEQRERLCLLLFCALQCLDTGD